VSYTTKPSRTAASCKPPARENHDDARRRIANPWRLDTALRHRWLVAERRASGSGWAMHDGDHATFHDACAYVKTRQPA
jgi:hypothetical protein